MKLYHFTSRHHINGCIKNGLTMGGIPTSIDPLKFIHGYQWLTKNKPFKQSWCEYSSLPYKRNDYRITIKIPKSEKNNLHHWLSFCRSYNNLKDAAAQLNKFGDPENWFLFKGVISPSWFRKITRNPKI